MISPLASLLRARLSESQPDNAHPDANLLTAFTERRLGRSERTAITKHLAACRECRDVLALAACVPVSQPGRSAFRFALRLAPVLAGGLGCLVIALHWEQNAPDWKDIATPKPPPAISPVTAPPPTISALPQHMISHAHNPAPKIDAAVPAPAPVAVPAPAPRTIPLEVMPPSLSLNQASVPQPPNASSPAQAVPGAVNTFAKSMFGAANFARVTPVEVSAPTSPANTIWSLDNAAVGCLRASGDGGRTWRTIRVDGRTEFYTLNADGPVVWVGGAGGKLFRSSDEGSSWTEVKLTHDAIVRINGNVNGVVVTTRSGMQLSFK